MFHEQCCILCLEKCNTTENSIAIDSSDQQSLQALETIKQHFKEELIMLLHISNKFVCSQCWHLVQSFHEFYMKIKNAHLTAINKLKSLQELEIPLSEIKVELHAIDKLESPPSIEPEVTLSKTIDTNNLRQKSDDEQCDILESDNNSRDIEVSCSIKKKFTARKKRQAKNPADVKIKGNHKNKSCHKTIDYNAFIAQHFKLECILCKEPLANFKELKIHFKDQHQVNGYAKCCGKKLFKRALLVDHIHTHNNPEYFKCQHCAKVLSDRSGLESHLQNFHDSKERTIYNCDICSKGFYRQKVLARHILIHAPEEEKNVKCTECDKRFCNQYSMKQHLALVHLNLYAKICDICGKALKGNEAFQRHLDEHAGVPRSPIKCKLCNAELKTKYGLARHMKAMHTAEGQTPQVCTICSKTSPSVRAHNSHMKNVHTEKRHNCKLCNKSFKRPRHLTEHMTTHTGEVLYTCTFCPQTFNSNANMYAHRKRKHPKEWEENCTKKRTVTGLVPHIESNQ
ncbi:transcription factor grauzone-like [Eurosta solidaginis]|uniref:transcription factor grauzone-like n=1 Tax=Eurosta solidaginis TaxID=178769 RepID=UPI003530D699